MDDDERVLQGKKYKKGVPRRQATVGKRSRGGIGDVGGKPRNEPGERGDWELINQVIVLLFLACGIRPSHD